MNKIKEKWLSLKEWQKIATVIGCIMIFFYVIGVTTAEDEPKTEEPKQEETVNVEKPQTEEPKEDGLSDEENKHIGVAIKVLKVSSTYPAKMSDIIDEGDFFDKGWQKRFRKIIDDWKTDILIAGETDLDYEKTPAKVSKIAEYTLDMQIETLKLCQFLYSFIGELESGNVNEALEINKKVVSQIGVIGEFITKLSNEADKLGK